MGIFKNKMKINKSQKYLENTDAHFLNRNYTRTGRADAQTDQQHSTSRVLICWLTAAWAKRCCAMPRSWFDFRIFIRVSNRIFLEFFVRASNRSTIEGPQYFRNYYFLFRVGYNPMVSRFSGLSRAALFLVLPSQNAREVQELFLRPHFAHCVRPPLLPIYPTSECADEF